MAIYEYALLAQRDADACLARARAAAAQWEEDWCKKPGLDVSCGETLAEKISSDARWCSHRRADGATFWSYQSDGLARKVQRLLFDLDNGSQIVDGRRESAIASSVADEALADLKRNLIRALTAGGATVDVDGEAPPEWQLRRTAGAALIQLAASGNSLGILLPHSLLPNSPSRREKVASASHAAALSPLPDALAATRARLSAELDGVEITLGQLTTLHSGDVLTLNHKLAQPLKIYTTSRHVAALAYLGKQEGQRAAQLAAVVQK
ncbi:MAG TPA: FliM/FliN family flagellar motor C-terminal domain-containing protein [Burkholderiaceae bacterium]